MSSYRCVFMMGVEQALEYRLGFFLSMLSTVFPIVIQTAMWNYLYSHSDAAGIFGYGQGEILLYTLLAAIVSQLVGTGFEWEMNRDIKLGGLNQYLIRPVKYRGYRFFAFLGQKVPRLMVIGPVMAVLIGGAVWNGMNLSPVRALAFLGSLMLAVVLNFSVFFCIGMLGFWFTDADKLFGAVSIVLTVASGGVFPLDIFGEQAEIMGNLLPFGYTIQFPVNIVNGRLGWERMGMGFALQVFWISVFVCLGEYMWRHGVRRYTAAGG